MTGRPSIYTAEIAGEICDRLACGESLAAICRDEGTPAMRTVMRWLREREDFRQNYTRAREEQGEVDADVVSDIRQKVLDGDLDPTAARVAMDAAKWSAGKRLPKKYGDALQMKHSGAIGVFDPSKHSDDELRTLLGVLEPAALAGSDGGGDQGGTGEA